jgi:hypothetical protein
MAAIAMLPTCMDNRVSPKSTCSTSYTSRMPMMTILFLGCLLQIAHLLRRVSSELKSTALCSLSSGSAPVGSQVI